jgi:hypothetical protein
MEIKPNKPVFIEPQQAPSRLGNRPPGTVSSFVAAPVTDAVDEFSFTKLLKLADTALAAGNPAAALEQYAKILTYEPNNIQALYGKALAEGLQSPDKLGETLGKLDQLLKSATGPDREALMARAGGDIIALGKKAETDALAALLRELTPANHELFADRMEETLVLYHTSALLLPTEEGILMAMIAASQRLMVPYRDEKSGKKFHPTEGIYEKGKKWLKKARDLLKEKFPNRFKRLQLYKKYQTCFIATAAWGDPEADQVVTFRAFRDLYLRNNHLGRRFIVVYYHHGSTVAGLIAENGFLRRAVRCLLAPLLWGVRLLPGMRGRRI